MKWFVLFFSDDTENEYFKGTEQEAKNAFADKKLLKYGNAIMTKPYP